MRTPIMVGTVLGHYREARPPGPCKNWALSGLYVALGDRDAAFRSLQQQPRHAFVPWIRIDPLYVSLRSDPRFAALLTEMKLPQP